MIRKFKISLLILLSALTLHGQTLRECVVATAEKYVGVKELTGKNDGPEVKAFLATCPLPEGYSWCGAFLGKVYIENCLPIPRGHCWAPSWDSKKTRVTEPRPGDIGCVFSFSKKRVVHVFLFTDRDGNNIYTIEGNTNSGGSSNGDGCLARVRDIAQVYSFNDHIGNR